MENLNQIIKQFPEVGEVKEVKALTSGLINQTYLVKTVDPQEADYVLQRINHQIFTDIDMLQHNIEVVTGHIRKKLEAQNETDIDRKVLRFLPATDGKTFYYDGEGYWRVSVFIPRSQTLEAVTPDSSYLAGLKFGEFQAMLADVPEQLGEIIPDFHNMEFRMKQLREAVATNAAGRLPTKCAVPKDCSAKANFRNVSATAILKSATCCLMKTVKCFALSTSTLSCPASSSPISVTSFVRQPIQAKKTKRI